MKAQCLIFALILALLAVFINSVNSEDSNTHVLHEQQRPQRQLEHELDKEIKDHLNDWVKKPDIDKDDDTHDRLKELPPPHARTATGGIINTLMVSLTFLAFFGNVAFLVHVFWVKETINHNLAPPKSILPFNNFGMGAE